MSTVVTTTLMRTYMHVRNCTVTVVPVCIGTAHPVTSLWTLPLLICVATSLSIAPTGQGLWNDQISEIIATHHIPSHWATAYNLHPSCECQFCSSVTRALPLILCVCTPILMQHWWNTLSSHVPTACSGLYCFHSVACIPLYVFFFWQTPVTAPTTCHVP